MTPHLYAYLMAVAASGNAPNDHTDRLRMQLTREEAAEANEFMPIVIEARRHGIEMGRSADKEERVPSSTVLGNVKPRGSA